MSNKTVEIFMFKKIKKILRKEDAEIEKNPAMNRQARRALAASYERKKGIRKSRRALKL